MLPTADLVKVGISVVVAGLLCTLRLRLALWTDTLYCIIVGAFTIYYAKDGLRQIVPTAAVDVHHEFLVCTRVVLLLMPAFTWLFCRTTVDITCRTAITLSRLVSYLGAAIVMAVEHFRLDLFSGIHLVYSLLPYSLWSFVMLVQLVRTGSRVNIHIRRVDINKFLFIDLVYFLVCAMAHLVAPAILLENLGLKLDSVHIYLHRVNGCVFLGGAVIPWIGQRFRYSEDKHTIMMASCLTLLIWFAGMGFGIWRKQIPLDLSTYVFLAQMGLPLLLNMVGTAICQNGPFTAAFWSSQRKSAPAASTTASPRRQ